MRRTGLIIAAVALAIAAGSRGPDAEIRVALEDRGDPNPRQIALGVELAGLAVGLAISWSERLRQAD